MDQSHNQNTWVMHYANVIFSWIYRGAIYLVTRKNIDAFTETSWAIIFLSWPVCGVEAGKIKYISGSVFRQHEDFHNHDSLRQFSTSCWNPVLPSASRLILVCLQWRSRKSPHRKGTSDHRCEDITHNILDFSCSRYNKVAVRAP